MATTMSDTKKPEGPNMANTFETLLKAAKAQRDTASQAVNAAMAQLDEANQQLTDLASAEAKADFADDFGFAAGAYLKSLSLQRRQILSQLPHLEKKLEMSRDELLDAFGECKKLEFVRERQRLEAEAVERRKDGTRLDEIAQRIKPGK
jgi:flagellar export protein FliJ